MPVRWVSPSAGIGIREPQNSYLWLDAYGMSQWWNGLLDFPQTRLDDPVGVSEAQPPDLSEVPYECLQVWSVSSSVPGNRQRPPTSQLVHRVAEVGKRDANAVRSVPPDQLPHVLRGRDNRLEPGSHFGRQGHHWPTEFRSVKKRPNSDCTSGLRMSHTFLKSVPDWLLDK